MEGANIEYSKSRKLTSVKQSDNAKITDLEVWQAFKKGSESAFIKIYEEYFQILLNYGQKFSKEKELVQDCIQDMFVELRESSRKLSDTDKIKPYLFKVLRNKILKNLKRLNEQVGIDEGFKPFDFVISYEENLINRQLSESQVDKLTAAISKLAAKEREAIFLFYYELYSYEEIAEIMGYKSAKIARNLVYRAVDSLRHVLEPNSSHFFLYSFSFL